MAETQSLEFDLSAPEPSQQPVYRRLGLINGLLIGLALGLGAWGAEAVLIASLPVPLYLPSLLLGVAGVTALCGLTGWVTSRIELTAVTGILWVLTAVACILIIGYLPFQGRTLVAWLADRRFWGQVIYPNTLGGTNSGLILGGLLLILVIGILGILQSYRLENIMSTLRGGKSLRPRTWLALLLPLPLVFLASYLTQSMILNPAATALELTDQAITRAQAYEGDDLRELGRIGVINYAALRGLEGRLGGDYTEGIAEANALTSTVVVAVDFEGGRWIYCRVINDQLTFCYDAAPAYINTLQSLITGQPLPDPCRGCDLEAAANWGAWFDERRDHLGSEPVVERLAQQGSQALFRISAGGGESFTVECWFEGVSPVHLTRCEEAR